MLQTTERYLGCKQRIRSAVMHSFRALILFVFVADAQLPADFPRGKQLGVDVGVAQAGAQDLYEASEIARGNVLRGHGDDISSAEGASQCTAVSRPVRTWRWPVATVAEEHHRGASVLGLPEVDVRHLSRAGQPRPRQGPRHRLAVGAQFADECAAAIDELGRHFTEPREPRAERNQVLVIGTRSEGNHRSHCDQRDDSQNNFASRIHLHRVLHETEVKQPLKKRACAHSGAFLDCDSNVASWSRESSRTLLQSLLKDKRFVEKSCASEKWLLIFGTRTTTTGSPGHCVHAIGATM